MPDEISTPQDPARVNITIPGDVSYWCAKFDCAEAELRTAVDSAGISAIAVDAYFARKSRPPFARQQA